MLEACELGALRRGRPLFEHVSLTLESGQVKALVAPNGYGKTTLLRILAGDDICATVGTVEADGIPADATPAYRANVMYAPGNARLLQPNMTVRESLDCVYRLWESPLDVGATVRHFGLAKVEKKQANHLSKGYQQQLTLALAYLSNVPYVLLDEPMNALDQTNRAIVVRAVRHMAHAGRAVLMSTHILSDIPELCSSVLFLGQDGVFETSVQEGGDYERLFCDLYGASDV